MLKLPLSSSVTDAFQGDNGSLEPKDDLNQPFRLVLNLGPKAQVHVRMLAILEPWAGEVLSGEHID